MTSQPYTDETIYPMEVAADTHGIQLGQGIIDGKTPVVSVNYDERASFNSKIPFERMYRTSRMYMNHGGMSLHPKGTGPLFRVCRF